MLVFSNRGRSSLWMSAGDEQQIILLRINLVDGDVHILKEVAVLAGDLFFRWRRHINRDAFFHESEIGNEELKILEPVGSQNDRPRERLRRPESFLVEFHDGPPEG